MQQNCCKSMQDTAEPAKQHSVHPVEEATASCTNCTTLSLHCQKPKAKGLYFPHLFANSFGDSTLKPLVSSDVSYSSSVMASASSSLSPCLSYLALREVITGWSGFTSRVRRPRMYSMARLSPMACSHALASTSAPQLSHATNQTAGEPAAG